MNHPDGHATGFYSLERTDGQRFVLAWAPTREHTLELSDEDLRVMGMAGYMRLQQMLPRLHELAPDLVEHQLAQGQRSKHRVR